MALLDRLSRLFRADLHAVLDRLEEPEALLRQSIREMEDALSQDERRLKARQLQAAQLDERARQLEASLQAIEPELALCLEAGNEALSRVLLRRRLENERLLGLLRRQREQLGAEIGEQVAALAERRQRLEALRQKAELFDVQAPRDEAAPYAETTVVTDADVELAWLREQQKRRPS